MLFTYCFSVQNAVHVLMICVTKIQKVNLFYCAGAQKHDKMAIYCTGPYMTHRLLMTRSAMVGRKLKGIIARHIIQFHLSTV